MNKTVLPTFSIVIPVYNRPDEVDELLASLVLQADKDFEVILVEDGSKNPCKTIADKYSGQLDLSYFFIPNSGPGKARNYGAVQSKGEYLLILDSDCILPEKYIVSVRKELNETEADAFGGPDSALDSFTPIQKAINYAMTSFFTTGGIRGGKKKVDKFYPRSFNMGIRRSVYNELNGFSPMRFGEDIDFSIRIYKGGYKVALFPSAYVYHKRRTDFRKFFKQVYNSGIARINLYKKYPESLKLVHCFPSLFIFFLILSILALPWCTYSISFILFYCLLIFVNAAISSKSIRIGGLSVIASLIQLIGYGCGFLSAFWNRVILKKGEFAAFGKNFYK
jgi:glycosyltransferase involved in cell wall biosynthesis